MKGNQLDNFWDISSHSYFGIQGEEYALSPFWPLDVVVEGCDKDAGAILLSVEDQPEDIRLHSADNSMKDGKNQSYSRYNGLMKS